jgi:hypothetical protein
VDDLTNAGVSAEAEIQEANYGHVPRKILAVADSCDARIIVVGSRGEQFSGTPMSSCPLPSLYG